MFRTSTLLLPAALIASLAALLLVPIGPQSAHMMLHIALMNAIAPVLAYMAAPKSGARGVRPALMWLSAALQIALLYLWHLPAMHAHAMHMPAGFMMHAMLFASALWFWANVWRLAGNARWHAVPALLITGKLVCLISALIIFAPRLLYGHASTAHAPLQNLDDQQLAGLLMITACPLSYLGIGIVLTMRLLSETGRTAAMRPR